MLKTRIRYVGFTLIELMVIVAILGILAMISIPGFSSMIYRGKVASTVADIAKIGQAVFAYEMNTGALPNSLTELSNIPIEDPWGNGYQYINFALVKGKGKQRKDRNLVPINTLFDLYSTGEDGSSVSPLTANASRDDIVWANGGQFIGLAVDY